MIFVYALIRVGLSFLSKGNILSAINPIGIITNVFFLNGFIPNDIINNQMVFGGWFVGTIVILYLLFPILYKIFIINNTKWKKVKCILFPLIIMFVSSFFLISICEIFHMRFLNNKFLYFSFINQIACFSIGFSLYELYINKTINKVKIPFIKFLIFLIISIITFYGNFKYSFIFVPFIFSISFSYLYITYTRCNRKSINKIIKTIEKFGNYNWTIYLCHSVIVYYPLKIIIKIVEQFVPSAILFFTFLPITYILIYYCGNLFQLIITCIENKIFKKS